MGCRVSFKTALSQTRLHMYCTCADLLRHAGLESRAISARRATMDVSKLMDGAERKGRRHAWCGPVSGGLYPEFRRQVGGFPGVGTGDHGGARIGSAMANLSMAQGPAALLGDLLVGNRTRSCHL